MSESTEQFPTSLHLTFPDGSELPNRLQKERERVSKALEREQIAADVSPQDVILRLLARTFGIAYVKPKRGPKTKRGEARA